MLEGEFVPKIESLPDPPHQHDGQESRPDLQPPVVQRVAALRVERVRETVCEKACPDARAQHCCPWILPRFTAEITDPLH